MADCIFCKIVGGEIPAQKLYEDDLVIAFPDIHPRARVHVLIVSREHLPSIAELGLLHVGLLMRLVDVANRLATDMGIALSGYRLLTNAGPDSGQEVQHLHFHLLGGERLGGFGAI